MTPEEEARQKFLMSMYDQMWNNMNRHINIIWQPVTVIFTIIGSILVAETQNLNVSIIFVIIFLAFLVIGWFLAHVYDSSNWYNRNLVIATNIEKQFLFDSDGKEIHPFFKFPQHAKNKMITHFTIQYHLGIGLALAISLYWIAKIIQNKLGLFNISIYIPLVGVIIAAYYVYKIKEGRDQAYENLVKSSPGKV